MAYCPEAPATPRSSGGAQALPTHVGLSYTMLTMTGPHSNRTFFVLLVALVTLAPATRLHAQATPAPVEPAQPGQKFSFGLWGDVPYDRSGDGPKIEPLI